MIHVIADIRTAPGARPRVLQALAAVAPLVRAEAGCLGYAATLDADTDLPRQTRDDTSILMVERWESLEHLKAHLEAPHMLAYREQVAADVVDVSLRVLTEA